MIVDKELLLQALGTADRVYHRDIRRGLTVKASTRAAIHSARRPLTQHEDGLLAWTVLAHIEYRTLHHHVDMQQALDEGIDLAVLLLAAATAALNEYDEAAT